MVLVFLSECAHKNQLALDTVDDRSREGNCYAGFQEPIYVQEEGKKPWDPARISFGI
jgi:hypothetical protein